MLPPFAPTRSPMAARAKPTLEWRRSPTATRPPTRRRRSRPHFFVAFRPAARLSNRRYLRCVRTAGARYRALMTEPDYRKMRTSGTWRAGLVVILPMLHRAATHAACRPEFSEVVQVRSCTGRRALAWLGILRPQPGRPLSLKLLKKPAWLGSCCPQSPLVSRVRVRGSEPWS